MATTKINWLTADKKKSIKSSSKPVYLIQPDGREPIGEAHYLEDAFFCGYDLFSWLSIMNLNVDLSELGRALSIDVLPHIRPTALLRGIPITGC